MEEIIEDIKDKPISVYVKTNEERYVTDVNSDIFIEDFTGWQKIDEGYGDKFAHAQSQYFEKELKNNQLFVYKLENNQIIEI